MSAKTKIIRAGKHRPWPPAIPRIWQGKKAIHKRIIFHNSCRYDFPGAADDADINKIFGLGYHFKPNGHHVNSARFGYIYCDETDRIILFSYCYVNGKRVYQSLCSIMIGVAYNLSLIIDKTNYIFKVNRLFDKKEFANMSVEKGHNRKWSHSLGMYFGGRNDETGKDNTAPHDMTFLFYEIK